MKHLPVFPFSAIVGQEKMKTALILNSINPKLGGVLIRGEKGTAKSTAVRSLAALLPEMDVVKGCRFRCDPNVPEKYCIECQEKAGKSGQFDDALKVLKEIASETSRIERYLQNLKK